MAVAVVVEVIMATGETTAIITVIIETRGPDEVMMILTGNAEEMNVTVEVLKEGKGSCIIRPL